MIRSRFFKLSTFFSAEFLIHGCFSSLFLQISIETDTQPLGCNLQLLKVIERKEPDSRFFFFRPGSGFTSFLVSPIFGAVARKPFAALFPILSSCLFALHSFSSSSFRLFAVSQCDHFSSSSAFRCTAILRLSM
jgi:hypothetical protein